MSAGSICSRTLSIESKNLGEEDRVSPIIQLGHLFYLNGSANLCKRLIYIHQSIDYGNHMGNIERDSKYFAFKLEVRILNFLKPRLRKDFYITELNKLTKKVIGVKISLLGDKLC